MIRFVLWGHGRFAVEPRSQGCWPSKQSGDTRGDKKARSNHCKCGARSYAMLIIVSVGSLCEACEACEAREADVSVLFVPGPVGMGGGRCLSAPLDSSICCPTGPVHSRWPGVPGGTKLRHRPLEDTASLLMPRLPPKPALTEVSSQEDHGDSLRHHLSSTPPCVQSYTHLRQLRRSLCKRAPSCGKILLQTDTYLRAHLPTLPSGDTKPSPSGRRAQHAAHHVSSSCSGPLR